MGFAQTEEKLSCVLPESVDELCQRWEIISSHPIAPTYDFLWNVVMEEGREKLMARRAFVTGVEVMPAVGDTSPNTAGVAEAALKVSAFNFHRSSTSLSTSLDGPRESK